MRTRSARRSAPSAAPANADAIAESDNDVTPNRWGHPEDGIALAAGDVHRQPNQITSASQPDIPNLISKRAAASASFSR